jgi:hypothetical protein
MLVVLRVHCGPMHAVAALHMAVLLPMRHPGQLTMPGCCCGGGLRPHSLLRLNRRRAPARHSGQLAARTCTNVPPYASLSLIFCTPSPAAGAWWLDVLPTDTEVCSCDAIMLAGCCGADAGARGRQAPACGARGQTITTPLAGPSEKGGRTLLKAAAPAGDVCTPSLSTPNLTSI